MALKLGKKPPRHDPRTLRLRNYLRLEALPPLPAAVNWSPAVVAAGGYPMFGNDQYGDCTIAGAAHLDQTWDANAHNPNALTDADILAAYSGACGYVPGDPSTDQGGVLLDVLNYWRKTGIGGHNILAYVAIDPTNIGELRYAIALFGGAYLGVALPDSVCRGDLLVNPWSDDVNDAPDPDNGHCIMLPDYDNAVTWGAVKPISAGFVTRYADEGYAILSEDWIDKTTSEGPNGIDLSTLMVDLAKVTQ